MPTGRVAQLPRIRGVSAASPWGGCTRQVEESGVGNGCCKRIQFYCVVYPPRRAQANASVILVAISGKIDAANADNLLGARRFRRYLRPGRALVLDLTEVSYLGV